MSQELEKLSNQLFVGQIPSMWLAVSYGSRKPLAGYFTDLLARIEFCELVLVFFWCALIVIFGGLLCSVPFFLLHDRQPTVEKWLKTIPPTVFWISGFFFTHAFTTGAKQNFARRYTIPIDNVVFDQIMLPKPIAGYSKKPKDGVYTHGLFLEGTRWDKKTEFLTDRQPKVLFTQAPLMWFVPMKTEELPHRSCYDCPVYKTSDRRGILATTGHSTNFVCFIRMPIPEHVEQGYWVERGACLLTQLDD